MALSITSLNSGSNGNCYYIGNDTEAIFVDAGISCRETEIRMKRLGLPMEKVKAIFVSHEHTDHILGIATLSKKYQLPVYITPKTLQHSKLMLETHLIRHFHANAITTVGSLSVTAFPKFHDACDPHSFVITYNDLTVGVFTDIGHSCEHVIKHFSKCSAAFLEANYDEAMLSAGRYPHYLKNRIRGDRGHLSNAQALELYTKHKPSFMSLVLLSHLSKDNNCPKLAQELFAQKADGAEIIVASRYNETPVYHINNTGNPGKQQNYLHSKTYSQLSLF